MYVTFDQLITAYSTVHLFKKNIFGTFNDIFIYLFLILAVSVLHRCRASSVKRDLGNAANQ